MSLKRRLIITNAAIVIIPIMITILASFVFFIVTTKILDKNVNYQNLNNISLIRYELSKKGSLIIQNKPEALLEKDFQNNVVSALADMNANIIVLKKHKIVFSTITMNKIDIEKCVEAVNEGLLNNSVKIGRVSYIVNLHSVTFEDGDSGKMILLAPYGKDEVASETFLILIIVVFLVSFLAVNILSAILLSRSILRPISRLQKAACEISCGNLEHEVIEEGDSEIKKLCNSFEQMRIKLKESVYIRMKYEDNRKMLISSISHDLKTPITSIKGYVEGILDGVANTPEKSEKYLRTIYAKAVQVDAMIDDLLLYSKLDLNQIPFNFEKTDIVRYFEDCIAESECDLEKDNIKISLENQISQNRYVMIDKERVRRVIVNIIDNARKYMDKANGEIKVFLRETNTSILIEVQDNGIGIPKENLPHIFDRFYRADAVRKSMNGSGLGLAIAKQIIEGHSGKIWAVSHEEKSTSIIISLRKA